MTLAEFKTLLETTGLPVTYRAWPEQKAPAMPFVCFLSPGFDNFGADGGVYYSAKRIRIELYSELYDETAMQKIEAALADIFWTKYTEYIDAERCYETIYECEV